MALFQDNAPLQGRLRALKGIFYLIFLLLLARVWQISILDHEHYSKLALDNLVRTVPIKSPRGLIYDREGRVLVENSFSTRLLLYREEIRDRGNTITYLAEGLEDDQGNIEAILSRAERTGMFRPVPIRNKLAMDKIAFFMTRQADHPEVGIDRQPSRVYTYGELGSHVVGYIGQISEKQLQKADFSDLKQGDILGKSGVENVYDSLLRGKDGWLSLVVDVVGKTQGEDHKVDAEVGNELVLSLDLDLQRAAEQALGSRPGAVVALDPRNGEVLVMASRPTFNPNDFALGIEREKWAELLENPDRPLQNRAIQSIFSPGSTFKIIMALAGLESGLIDPKRTIECHGSITMFGRPFGCSRPEGHGTVDLNTALVQSCNVYFYLLGSQMGIDRISKFSSLFGLGNKTGVDLPGEVPGVSPSREWKRRVKGEPWYRGDTISVSIGQGLITVTPLQLARAVGIVAVGHAVRPRLVRRTGSSESTDTTPVEIAPRHLELVREAMWGTVNGWGTGRAARVDGFDVCGKTGTAQVIGRTTRKKLTDEDAAKFEDNAWFVGFAPLKRPEIVVVAIVQRGGSGGANAGPVARQVFETYYKKHYPNEPDRVQAGR